mgnify:CR=1 FL=1
MRESTLRTKICGCSTAGETAAGADERKAPRPAGSHAEPPSAYGGRQSPHPGGQTPQTAPQRTTAAEAQTETFALIRRLLAAEIERTKKVCGICGHQFRNDNNQARYCSPECSNSARRSSWRRSSAAYRANTKPKPGANVTYGRYGGSSSGNSGAAQ